jgi:Flp pilus assembly protein TadG
MILSRFKSEESGVTAVEFALVAPVFIVMLLGMMFYGMYFAAAHSVQELAADAARASVAGLSTSERQKIVADYVAGSSGNYLLLRAADVVASGEPHAGDPLRFDVTVQVAASNLPTGILDALFPVPSSTIARTAVVRIGGF